MFPEIISTFWFFCGLLKNLQVPCINYYGITTQLSFSSVQDDDAASVFGTCLLLCCYRASKPLPLHRHAWVDILLDADSLITFTNSLQDVCFLQHFVFKFSRCYGDQNERIPVSSSVFVSQSLMLCYLFMYFYLQPYRSNLTGIGCLSVQTPVFI